MISRVSGAQTSLALRKGDYELYKLRELVRMNLASNLYGETQWLPARYVKAKRSAVHNVREQERKEAANVNIAVELERERATIAKEADKSKLSGFALLSPKGCNSKKYWVVTRSMSALPSISRAWPRQRSRK